MSNLKSKIVAAIVTTMTMVSLTAVLTEALMPPMTWAMALSILPICGVFAALAVALLSAAGKSVTRPDLLGLALGGALVVLYYTIYFFGANDGRIDSALILMTYGAVSGGLGALITKAICRNTSR